MARTKTLTTMKLRKRKAVTPTHKYNLRSKTRALVPPQETSAPQNPSSSPKQRKRRTPEHCVICLDTSAGCYRRVKCGHIFHTKCIAKWLKRSSSCPVCRSSIRRRHLNPVTSRLLESIQLRVSPFIFFHILQN